MKLQLLAGGALVALLAGCGSDPVTYSDPYYVSSSGGYYYRDAYRNPYYGDTRVETIEVLRGTAPAPVVVAPPVATADMYRVTVRKPDGSYETYVMQSLGTLRTGDRVRIVNGTIYPIG
jgi:hypothetical protein